jgi:hypothetical protein
MKKLEPGDKQALALELARRMRDVGKQVGSRACRGIQAEVGLKDEDVVRIAPIMAEALYSMTVRTAEVMFDLAMEVVDQHVSKNSEVN